MNKMLVSVIMGSASDAPFMQGAADILASFEVPFEWQVVSAHRSPELMFDFARTAIDRGVKVIIAGAGGAAHLPGMVAALTTAPVIGVPVKSANSIDGWDSLLSIVQMPQGVPVATVAINGALNAGLLAIQMLAIHNQELQTKLLNFKLANVEKVMEQRKSFDTE